MAGGPSLRPDPGRAPRVAEAYKLFATGRYTKRAVLRRVTALGLRNQAGRALSPQTFDKLLSNPIYQGRIVKPKYGIDVVGDFQALVSEALFAEVQEVVLGRRPGARRYSRNHDDFPLRRHVRCAACGGPMTGSWSTGRTKRYGYYRCPKSTCRAVNVGREDFHARFVEYLEHLQPEAGLMRLFNAIVRDIWGARHGEALRGSAEHED